MTRSRLQRAIRLGCIRLGCIRLGCQAGAAIGFSIVFASVGLAHDSLGDIGGTVDRGAVNADGTMPQPWIHKYYSAAGACLHFQVLQVVPAADLKMVVIGPSPLQRFRDDDSGSTGTCTFCPRVEIDPTPVTGYYTVIIDQFAGAATEADFTLEYARRTTGAASCPNPTTQLPLSLPLSAPKIPEE